VHAAAKEENTDPMRPLLPSFCCSFGHILQRKAEAFIADLSAQCCLIFDSAVLQWRGKWHAYLLFRKRASKESFNCKEKILWKKKSI